MAVGGEDESKKKSDRPTDLLKFNMKYGRLVVFIRHDSAEIWGYRCGLTLCIGTLKIMASTGVFVRVVCPLNRSISSFPRTPSMILTYSEHMKSHSHQKMGRERYFSEGRQRTGETERQRRIVVDLIN